MTETSPSKSGATLVRLTKDSMIVSFQDAKSPSVWRVKRDALDEATFKVVENGDLYDLVFLKAVSDKGEVVSQYENRTAATSAMNAIMDVVIEMDGGLDVPQSVKPASQRLELDDDAKSSATAVPAAKVVTNTTPKEMENDAAMTQVTAPAPRKRIWVIGYWLAFAFFFVFFLAAIFFGVQNAESIAGEGGISTDGAASMLPDRPNRDTMGGDVEDMPEVEQGRPLSADEYFSNSLDGE